MIQPYVYFYNKFLGGNKIMMTYKIFVLMNNKDFMNIIHKIY